MREKNIIISIKVDKGRRGGGGGGRGCLDCFSALKDEH